MNADSMVEMGMVSRGKYTLLKIAELEVKVADTRLIQAAKNPHKAVPAR